MRKIIGFYRKCDLLTMCGTASSLTGMMLLLAEHYTLAVLMMVISGLCDAFDGTLARKYQSSKDEQTYGVQLDSLSDVICFGVFPALITAMVCNNIIAKIICVFYVICGLIRLAYFNTLNITGEGKKNTFIGVPITTVSIVYPIVFLILRIVNFSLVPKVMPIVLMVLGISFIVKIEIPKINITHVFKKIFNEKIIDLILFPLFIILTGDMFFRLVDNGIIDSIRITIISFFDYFFVNLCLILILDICYLILNNILKNTKKTKIIILVIATIIMVINDVKYNIMGIPLEIADINYLNPDNISMMGNAGSSIGYWIFYTIIKTIIFIGIGVVFILRKNNKVNFVKDKKKRIILFIVCFIILAGFGLINEHAKEFVIKNLYRTNTETLSKYSSVSNLYDDFGFYPAIYINELYDNTGKPEGYTKKKVNSIFENVTEEEEKWEKANVIFILSEAFSYLENIDEIEFDKDLTANINTYMNSKNTQVFDLLVPSYGGVSVNTEFEILTGASLSFWKTGFIPYTQYYNKISGSLAPNIIKEFNNNDYETVYLTPWGKDSYKSKYVYDLFGANKTIYGTDLNGENKGTYYSDKSLMEDIYNELLNTEDGKYKFIMAATGQNHYPYDSDIYDTYDINVTYTAYNEEDTTILKNYAQGIYDADKELNNLYEKIQELDTPTIIVFYGDHLPYTLNSKGSDPYTGAEYFNTENEDLNELRKKTTKAVILSNYDIEIDDLKYINVSYLGAYIINKLDIEISDYFKSVNNIRKIVQVFNRNTIYLNNKTYSYDETSEEIKDALTNYEYIQYGSFYEYVK